MATAMPHSRYSQVAIALHWIIALLIIGNLVGGITLAWDLVDGPFKFTLLGLHQSFGLTILALSLVRLGWRLANPPPPLPAHMMGAEKVLARVNHALFYVVMLVIPLTGWAMTSANPKNFPIPYFGLFNVPHLPVLVSAKNAKLYYTEHEYLGYATIALLVLHVAGALKHHYLDRDDVLARIAPWVRRRV